MDTVARDRGIGALLGDSYSVDRCGAGLMDVHGVGRRPLGDMSMNDVACPTCTCSEPVSEEELLFRVDDVISEYRGKAGALIPVLQTCQAICGYLPESVLKRVAVGLDKPYSEVAGVVGFYSFFSTVPRGRHMIRVCLGTACYVRGGKEILDALKQRLHVDVGGTTADRTFSLEVARCFGACGLAPAIMIDEDVHQRVKPTKLQSILNEYRERDEGAEVGG